MEVYATIQASSLFREMAAAHPGVEVWPDDGFTEGGWSYAWIVSRFGEGNVRKLTYVRVQAGQLQCRKYDEAGDDLWVATE